MTPLSKALPISPACGHGRHRACEGNTADVQELALVACQCPCHQPAEVTS